MIIPTFNEALEQIKAGKATPLDVFVYCNEPGGMEEEQILWLKQWEEVRLGSPV